MKYHEEGFSEMSPDVYSGPGCDQHCPRWYTSTEGDMGDGDHSPQLELAAKHFPAGTRVSIQIPCCPNCDLPADFSWDHDTGEAGPCECGFDWKAWASDRYS